MTSSYLNKKFTNNIPIHKIKTILECGSRDALDAVDLYNYYRPCQVYAFECNPESIPVCKFNINGHPYIKLIEKAVYNTNGIVYFYPTDMDRSIDKNIGASSMLWHRDNKNEYFQKKLQVEAIRLDTFLKEEKISTVDLLCMDVQGVEIELFEGMGDYLKDVRYIISEVCFEKFYEGGALYPEIKEYLEERGFIFITGSGFVGNRFHGLTNCLFRNKNRT